MKQQTSVFTTWRLQLLKLIWWSPLSSTYPFLGMCEKKQANSRVSTAIVAIHLV
jgi:hypothetical protein